MIIIYFGIYGEHAGSIAYAGYPFTCQHKVHIACQGGYIINFPYVLFPV